MSFYRQKTLSRMSAPVQAATQNYTLPSCVKGVNALDPLINMSPEDCFYTYNLMPAEYGMTLRKGYREWAKNIGDTHTEVRSVVPFEGRDAGNNKLFAVTADGIWDCTSADEIAPTRVVVFADTTLDAGFVTWTEMTLDNDEQKLFVADARNGLHMYDEDTNTWSVPAISGTGIAAADVAFVILHKQRLWLIQRGEADAYYGPVDAIAGSFTKFTFGSKFKYGGELLLLANWTLDGGDGVDDYLVGVSRGGDVLTYRGSDPSQPDWSLTGSFFIGQMPNSRRVASGYGGQLFLLSTYGIASLQDLVQGVDFIADGRSPSVKINRILRVQVKERKDFYGWQMTVSPSDGFLQILQPWEFLNDSTQYTQNLLTQGWGFWRDVPAICADTWQGQYYIGGPDGVLYAYDGTVDNTLIGDPPIAGNAIEFSTLTSFQSIGEHGQFMRVDFCRTVYLSAGVPNVNTKTIYDYNILGQADAASGSSVGPSGVWDTGIWETDIWGSVDNGGSDLEGVSGIGRTVAIAMKGSSSTGMTVIGWDMAFTPAGYL